MVANSLNRLLDKFPYFLNKNPDSNFYKVQDVTNESLKGLYNDLFQVYESFHLNKRLLTWKEQNEPYNYNIHFVAKYPHLKKVSILKNNDLIYLKEYAESEDVNEFEFIYTCKYAKVNMPEVKVFRCENCGGIYFSNDNLTTCDSCGEPVNEVNVYECQECGSIYFSETQPETCNNCGSTDLLEIKAYKCNNCNEVYLGLNPPEVCSKCGITSVIDINNLNNFTGADLTIIDNRMIFPDETDNDTTTGEVTSLDDVTDSITTDYTTILDNDDEDEGFPDDTVPDSISYYEQFKIEIPICPADKFIFTVETYDEYILTKGYPENDIIYDYTTEIKDKIQTDLEELITTDNTDEYSVDDIIFNHDYSLDEFGALNDIPRKQYIDITNPELYPLTEPPYNNSNTEDDYHYMKRILEYNLRMWDTPAPVLEIWKLYGLDSVLLNRERLLLKMFDENKHPFNTETELVEEWYPMEWEHKDRFCDGSISLGEYFFVTADTVRPVLYQNVNVRFRVLDSLAQEITDSFYVDMYYYLEEEGVETKKTIVKGFTGDSASISYKLFDTTKPTVLRFEYYKIPGEILSTEEIVINVRDCNDGDWYVSSTGNDVTGDGSSSKPFKTLQKALSLVNNALDLIIVKGDLEFDNKDSIPIINANCIIMGCDNATITSNYQRQFFHLVGDRNVHLSIINLTLKNDEIVTEVKCNEYYNLNPDFYNYSTVIIHGGATTLTFTIDKADYYPYDYVKVTGTILSKDNLPLKDKTLDILADNIKLDSVTTDDTGSFSKWVKMDVPYTTGDHSVQVHFDTQNYFETLEEKPFNMWKPTTIRVKYHDQVTLSIDKDTSTKFYYKDDNLIKEVPSVDGVCKLEWTPAWGEYTVYTYQENIHESVENEWNIITYMEIEDLTSNEFITSIDFLDNGDFVYTTKTVTQVKDLTDLLTEINIADDLKYDVTIESLNEEDYTVEEWESTNLTPKELGIISRAITGITVNDNGEIELQRGI